MLTIRDALYLAAFAVAGSLWYADHATLNERLNNARIALESTLKQNEQLEFALAKIRE